MWRSGVDSDVETARHLECSNGIRVNVVTSHVADVERQGRRGCSAARASGGLAEIPLHNIYAHGLRDVEHDGGSPRRLEVASLTSIVALYPAALPLIAMRPTWPVATTAESS